jgi:hypothetical protein
LAGIRRTSCKFKKKRTIPDEEWEPADLGNQGIIDTGYVQNSEQRETTIWQRIQNNRNAFKPIDTLYREYDVGGFNNINLDGQDLTDPRTQELINYIEKLKKRSIKLDDIPLEYQQALASLLDH